MKRFVCAILLGMVAMPAMAQAIDPAALSADPGDRPVVAEAMAVLVSESGDIAPLDAVLAKLPRPTPLRGLIQTARAFKMIQDSNEQPAIAAIEEAMRLLPDHAYPKIVASYVLTFTGTPGRAADLWLEASRMSPADARGSDSYMIRALIGRLRETGDPARADRLEGRLSEIGFANTDAATRSASALARVREAMRNRREDIALAEVTAIGSPSDLLPLYLDRSHASLWPRIEEWAGADFASQAERHLSGLRADWVAGSDFASATPYARALVARDAPQAVVNLFLPLFDGKTPGETDRDSEYLAPVVSRALSQLDRHAEAEALLDRMAQAWSGSDSGNILNFQAAKVTLGMQRADWAGTIAAASMFAQQARAFGDDINPAGPTQIEGARACALWQAGRAAEADHVAADVLIRSVSLPEIGFALHLCRGDQPAARRMLIAALQSETHRGWALRMVQPTIPSDRPSAYERLIYPIRRQVTTAPDVVAAANKVGRILPNSLDQRLPAGFDPYRGRVRDRTPGAGDT